MTGHDLINSPDLAANRQIAVEILVHGMVYGTYTCNYSPDRWADDLSVSLCAPESRETLAKFELGGPGNYNWHGARDIINTSTTDPTNNAARQEAANQAVYRYGPKLRDGCQRGFLPGIQCGG